MTARTTADIDISVPNGQVGYGTLLDIFNKGPFIQYKDNRYFYVHSSGNFVEVDGIIAGWQNFPKLTEAKIIKAGPQMQLNFLEPAGLLRLKLASWASPTRRTGPKRNGDMSDTTSIRDLLIDNNRRVSLKGLDGDAAVGLKAWVKEFRDLNKWQLLDPSYKG
ncbi:hypothetical protein VMCG_10807 [Cytospora schulzeri]|uniref:Uncharacterized protein n=1 Tax=Cytospora schulzeri TaxID=448051 RepID=A0A423V7U5_9PEZI|nr:hypothetical protein VMCG_10807 [Valsa malicola]